MNHHCPLVIASLHAAAAQFAVVHGEMGITDEEADDHYMKAVRMLT